MMRGDIDPLILLFTCIGSATVLVGAAQFFAMIHETFSTSIPLLLKIGVFVAYGMAGVILLVGAVGSFALVLRRASANGY